MIHIGFTGGGNITETHLRAALAIPQAQIAAIHGRHVEKVRVLAQQYGGCAYEDFSQFLAHRPMDMIVVGSPSGAHAEQGIAAAANGLHVLTEKPIDTSTERADALIDATKRSGVELGVIFQDRLKPDILRLKKWIDAGRLGRPILVEASVKWYRSSEYYQDSSWRGTLSLDGGGALINQGIHTVDLLGYLLGRVSRVQAVVTTALHNIEAEDTCVATLEFANGAVGTLQATTAAYPGYARQVEITGSGGTVRLEQDRITRVDLRNPISEGDKAESSGQDSSANSPMVRDIRGHQRIMEDFIECLQTGGTPVCDGTAGRQSLALVETIYRAARSHEAVTCC